MRLDRGTELFGANVDKAEVRAMLGRFPTSHRGLAIDAARANAEAEAEAA
jgi:hypothetical protein